MQNQPTILQKIVQDKALWVEQAEKNFPLSQFKDQIQPRDRDFYGELAKGTHSKPA